MSTRENLSRIRARTNHLFDLAFGLLLIIAAVFEMFDTALEQWLGAEIGVVHGVMAAGVMQVVRSIKDLMDAYHFTRSAG